MLRHLEKGLNNGKAADMQCNQSQSAGSTLLRDSARHSNVLAPSSSYVSFSFRFSDSVSFGVVKLLKFSVSGISPRV